MSSERPSFPGLYDPHFELNSNYLLPTAPNGQYLVNAGDIYLFTLYWTLILYAPLFLITGACAALFLALDPLRRIRTSVVPASNSVRSQNKFINAPRRRSIAYGAVVFLIYIVVGTALTVIGSTVVGFLIAGVYEAGGFKVSTWVPFVWALLQTLVALTRFAPTSLSYALCSPQLSRAACAHRSSNLYNSA